MEQEVIEISSDEDEVPKKHNKSMPSKKRTLSNSATGPPSKRRMGVTLNIDSDMAMEVLDSDDELLTAMKAIPTKDVQATAVSDTNHVARVKVECGAERMASSASGIKDATKDKDGRYIVTQKVKVDSIENLREVPSRWPIPPEGTSTAYVIDLNNDKKWQDLDTNNKKKGLDRFLKQEVCLTFLHC